MSESPSVVQALAAQLTAAWPGNRTQVGLDASLIPGDESQSYAIQDLVIKSLGSPIAAWKVGAKSTDGPIQAAPLPASGVRRAPATIQRGDFGVLVLELELAFRFGRDFAPCENGYREADVMDAISETVTTIEIVSSRYAGWPVDKHAMLADLQSHGGLVVGEAVPYDASFPFAQPALTFTHEGRDVIPPTTGNPAGDPRRLLPWMVNHAARRGMGMPAGTLVTCGTYTGMYAPEGPGVIVGQFDGLPEIRLTIA